MPGHKQGAAEPWCTCKQQILGPRRKGMGQAHRKGHDVHPQEGLQQRAQQGPCACSSSAEPQGLACRARHTFGGH